MNLRTLLLGALAATSSFALPQEITAQSNQEVLEPGTIATETNRATAEVLAKSSKKDRELIDEAYALLRVTGTNTELEKIMARLLKIIAAIKDTETAFLKPIAHRDGTNLCTKIIGQASYQTSFGEKRSALTHSFLTSNQAITLLTAIKKRGIVLKDVRSDMKREVRSEDPIIIFEGVNLLYSAKDPDLVEFLLKEELDKSHTAKLRNKRTGTYYQGTAYQWHYFNTVLDHLLPPKEQDKIKDQSQFNQSVRFNLPYPGITRGHLKECHRFLNLLKP